MLFDKTRLPAMIFCTAFHFMNSRLFSIGNVNLYRNYLLSLIVSYSSLFLFSPFIFAGMFPYVCLATMPLFCNVDWPRTFHSWFTRKRKILLSKCVNVIKNCLRSPVNKVINEQKKEVTDPNEFDSQKATMDVNEHYGSSENVKPNDNSTMKIVNPKKVTKKQQFVVSMLLLHIALQFFLPYSHFITKVNYNEHV